MTQFTRREFTGMLGGAAAMAAPAKPWNLLLIINDQLRFDCLGVNGNPVIRTPVVDRLAGEGVNFEQYYVQCPQCVPSRAALHSGRYPHVNRTPTNLFRLADTEQTLARVLNGRGYRTAAVGDMPFAPTKAMGGISELLASVDEHAASLRAAGFGDKMREHAERLKTGFQAHAVPWPEDLDETPFFARKAIDFIRQPHDRPFFLHLNLRRPHHPFDPPAPYDRMYQGAKFPASHKREGEMAKKPAMQQKSLASSVGFDLRTMSAADLDRIKSYYYGMVSENDKWEGEILKALAEAGLAENTVVAFCADHGEMLGDHGLLYKGGYFYDEVVHVPLILRAPGKLPAGRRVRAFAEEIDLMPTLLELLGVPAPGAVQGKSLMPLIEEREKSPRRAVFSEFPTTKMVRTAEWKLVHYVRAPYGELYNLKDDPHELDNLYDDAGYTRQRAEMKSRLADWLVETQDPALPPLQA